MESDYWKNPNLSSSALISILESPTFPLDTVVLLAMLMRQGVGTRLGQHVLWTACDTIFTLGVLGAQAVWCGQALDLPAKWTLAGAHSLPHCTARHYRILLGTTCTHKRSQLLVIIFNYNLLSTKQNYFNLPHFIIRSFLKDNQRGSPSVIYFHLGHTEKNLSGGKTFSLKYQDVFHPCKSSGSINRSFCYF